MLALRALVGLCGIAYLEIDGRNYLMDVFPAARKGARAGGIAIRASGDEVQLMAVPKMEHRHWWLLLQRLLRTSARFFECWRSFDSMLVDCDVRLLSRHRNELLYRGAWFFDDLHEAQTWESFGNVDAGQDVPEFIDKLSEPTGSDGALILGWVLLGNDMAMLRDLGRHSRRVDAEVQLMTRTLVRFGGDGLLSRIVP